MADKYHRTPQDVAPVSTKYRRIATQLPVPESLPILEKLATYEPESMQGQPPLIWGRAEGVQVSDPWGNTWLDWSSGVLVTNAGHGCPEIRKAIQQYVDKPLLATYVFPHEARANLCETLAKLAPEGRDKVFLLSTGSEATENTIKLARTYGIRQGGERKHVIVSFSGAFHGRTLGAQAAGGMPNQKAWIVELPGGFVQVPFPDGFVQDDVDFAVFERSLREQDVHPGDVAGVITETYQGVGPNFLPQEYADKLQAWCRSHDVVLIADEVQAGFGRTGTFFGFEQYNWTPDLIACGKGLSSSLPISAVIGRSDIMGLYPPGSMTSTHSASPLPTVAALANIEILKDESLLRHVREMGDILAAGLQDIKRQYPERVGAAYCRGLVGGLLMVQPGTKTPDAKTALAINESCFQKGLLMFAPVGLGGECIKIAPPLAMPRDALEEGLAVLREAFAENL